MDSKIGFEMHLIVVEAIRGRCASFTVLTATVSKIFGGQTTPSILVPGSIDCVKLFVCQCKDFFIYFIFPPYFHHLPICLHFKRLQFCHISGGYCPRFTSV